jgi:hypothetical protein
MDIQEYIIASIKIPIRLIDGGKSTSPCQERCQIEFYRCDNLDEFPENNSLESNAIMSKFSQFFSAVNASTVETPEVVADAAPDLVDGADIAEVPAPVHKEIVVSKKYPSKQKTFRVHQGGGASMRFTRRSPI